VGVVQTIGVHLELITCLRVEAWSNTGSCDGRVDGHDEHRGAVAREDVHVVDVELSILACEWRIRRWDMAESFVSMMRVSAVRLGDGHPKPLLARGYTQRRPARLEVAGHAPRSGG
jgi:hypothetical protein